MPPPRMKIVANTSPFLPPIPAHDQKVPSMPTAGNAYGRQGFDSPAGRTVEKRADAGQGTGGLPEVPFGGDT